MADLPDVSAGPGHLQAHNDERHVINALNAILFPTAPPPDGQLLAYSSTLGKYAPVAPSGQSEIAAAVNASGTSIPLAVQDYGGQVYTPLTGMSLLVPASNGRPVTIEWDGLYNQTTAGSGNLWIQCSGGPSSLLTIHKLPIDTGIAANAADYFDTFHGTARIGVVAAPTTYTLSAMVYRSNSANSPVVNIMPLATAPMVMRALAG